MGFIKLKIGILVLCVSVFEPVLGYTTPNEIAAADAYALGEVVVTGKKAGVESIGTVYHVDEEDIRLSGARNLNEAVDMLPGINVMVGGDAVPKIDIRGFRPRHNIILLNGIPINSTYDQQFNPSIIPVENIAEIKMTSGPSSVLYGPGGLGGVINIITKSGTEGFRSMVGGEVGQGGAHIEKVNLSGRRGRVDFFSSGSFHYRDAFPLAGAFHDTALETGRNRGNSDKENASFFSNIGYDAASGLSMGLTVNYLSGSYGIPVVVYDALEDEFASNKRFERIERFNGYSLQAAAEYSPDKSQFSMRGWMFFNQMAEKHNRYSDSSYDSFTANSSLVTYCLESQTTIKGVTLQPKYDIGDTATLTMGLNAEFDTWESKGDIWNIWSADWPPGYVVNTVDDEKDVSLYTISSEYVYAPLTNLGFTIGYGYHFQRRHDASDIKNIVKSNHKISKVEDSDSDYSFLLGTYCDIFENMRLKAGFQRNIRFPSIRQLYDEDAGNQALTTERVYHYALGVEYEWNTFFRMSVDGFHTIAKDYIEKDSRQSEQFENFDEYLFAGAEVTLDMTTLDAASLRLSYSYLETEDNTTSGRKELQYRPKNRITFEGKYHFPWGLTPYVACVYVADQYYYTKGGNPRNPIERAQLDDYAVVNLKLNYALNDNYMLYLGADNVLDEYYEQSYGYPLCGRYVYGGGEVRF